MTNGLNRTIINGFYTTGINQNVIIVASSNNNLKKNVMESSLTTKLYNWAWSIFSQIYNLSNILVNVGISQKHNCRQFRLISTKCDVHFLTIGFQNWTGSIFSQIYNLSKIHWGAIIFFSRWVLHPCRVRTIHQKEKINLSNIQITNNKKISLSNI